MLLKDSHEALTVGWFQEVSEFMNDDVFEQVLWLLHQLSIEADVAASAPTNGDGSINLVAYAAWLIRQLAEGEPHGD